MIDDVRRNVPGALSDDACRILYNLIEHDLPKDGVILDLNCGEGRSTIVAARALNMTDKPEAQILALDTHITDPRSGTPHEDGTLMPFLRYLRMFKVMARVFPLVAPPSAVSRLLNKKCANIVLVQNPSSAVIAEAQFAIRKGGHIVVFVAWPEFPLDQFFPETDYKKTTNYGSVQVWTSLGAKDK